MKVKVRLFATYREKVGRGELEMEVEEGATIGTVAQRLEKDFPQLRLRPLIAALNSQYVEPDALLREGDEVAFLPPMSGG
ncbi:MAG: molybdopterin converting factor subunit 1 [Chloroflexota bacterium]|nr:molybdopterin converting factor subunit 1 [Chloroflexota bacterium]